MDILNPWQPSFPEPLWPFYGVHYKKLESYKVGHWKISQLKFYIIFGQYVTFKEEEGWSWRKRLYFQLIPSPLPHHSIELPQQGQTPPSLRTDFLWMSVEESQFGRRGNMLSGGAPQGFDNYFLLRIRWFLSTKRITRRRFSK